MAFLSAEVEGRAVETTFSVSIHFNSLLQEAIPTRVELQFPRPAPPPEFSAGARVLANEFEAETGEQVHSGSEHGFVPARGIYTPEPEFSDAARQKHEEKGHVNIALVVGTDGLPQKLKLICSSIPDSTQNAVDTIRKWKFSPATKDGQPVASTLEVDVAFEMN